MKIVAQAHSSLSHQNGASGRTFARNGEGVRPVNTRPVPPLNNRATPTFLSASAKTKGENGTGHSSGRFSAGPNEVPRREFLPVAAGRSEAGAGLPGRAVLENEIIFFYCIKGRGWCEVEGRRHEILPGQLVVMPAKMERRYATYGERSWSLIWIQLAEITTEAFDSKTSLIPQTTTLEAAENAQALALFQAVLQALELPSQQCLLQVSQMAADLLDSATAGQRKSCQLETDTAGRIGRTVEYMKDHLNESLRAATLAGVANMSLPHYFAQFKRIMGGSPIDYLIKLRMEHARRLLSETSWSVKEVAVSLGYDDPLYFSRVFKSINQAAPSDFRAKNKNAAGG
jgi:AraC-like DNA-binding protein